MLGTANTGSAGELVETADVKAGDKPNDWNALTAGDPVGAVLTVSVAPVMLIDCVLVTAHVVGFVRKNLTSVSLPRTLNT